jgi:hypothetical protein
MTSLADISPLERFALVSDWLRANGPGVLAALSPLSFLAAAPMPRRTAASQVDRSLVRVVAVLAAFEDASQRVLGPFDSIYLLGDEQVARLSVDVGLTEPLGDTPGPRVLLESLSTLGLLYRFNAARKFGYSDRGVVQLRLNSWGRRLSEYLRLERSREYRLLADGCAHALVAHEDAYRELLRLCRARTRPLNVAVIHRLNATVPYSVVT